MITREQIEEALGPNKNAYKTKGIDYTTTAIYLLRERIPYEKCRSIIGGAEHDIIYLCDVDIALPYLSAEDLEVLADCNIWVEDGEYFGLFV